MKAAVHFAKDGAQAISAILERKCELLLLDLNMPVLDGYGTLQQIKEQGLGIKTIVISGDVQPEAQIRVTELGALDFIQKPVNSEQLLAVLEKHQFLNKQVPNSTLVCELDEIIRDCYQEVVNVAMGQAADHLARIMGVFVKLPIPNVNLIEVSELHMMLCDIDTDERTSGVCQGFLGDGISGEALFILSDSSFGDVAKILGIEGEVDDQIQLELLMDAASLLIGTCLSSIAKQLDMQFRQGHPVVLGQHQSVQELINANKTAWRKTLAIEVSYQLEGFDVNCDLILLFTEESMDMMNAKLAHLLED
jgi:chemotaxis protein CheY-P-specific phosphatase CheC